MKVVFYSRDGNSAAVAGIICTKEKGCTIELKEKTKRKGIFGFIKSGFQAVRGKKSKLIGEPWKEIENDKELYLITPIWASNITPAVNTFLDKADFKNKKVITVTVGADPKFEGTDIIHTKMKKIIEAKNGKVTKTINIQGSNPGKFKGIDHIKKQLKKL